MNLNVYSGLIYNAALLLTLGVIFDAISLRGNRKSLLTEALTGSYLAFVLIAIMVNPWIIERGIMFDTRSILLSLVGMFMGIIPICIAVGGALIFRIFQGGGGVYMGCSVIIASTLMGFIWKNLHHKWKRPFGFWEFYSLGIATHIAMLLLTSLLPAGTRMEVLHTIALPVISIYPIGTLLLG
ncbi:MAG: LytS/YhcK type 5TM receptor domain-containing protein, partial [Candidatus Cloacimonas sp.]|nr:LytS/YhcK type 5TM receptor domain-containing protein [Candidatus Cloacimonas sp.]